MVRITKLIISCAIAVCFVTSASLGVCPQPATDDSHLQVQSTLFAPEWIPGVTGKAYLETFVKYVVDCVPDIETFELLLTPRVRGAQLTLDFRAEKRYRKGEKLMIPCHIRKHEKKRGQNYIAAIDIKGREVTVEIPTGKDERAAKTTESGTSRKDLDKDKIALLKRALKSSDETLFNLTLIQIRREFEGYDKSLERILIEALSQHNRISFIAKGYLIQYGGRRTVELLLERLKGGAGEAEISMIRKMAEKGVMKDEILLRLKEYVLRSIPQDQPHAYIPSDISSAVGLMGELRGTADVGEDDEVFNALEKAIREYLDRYPHGGGLAILISSHESVLLDALVSYSEKGVILFCELVNEQGKWNIRLPLISKVLGNRVKIKDEKKLNDLLEKKAVTAETLLYRKKPAGAGTDAKIRYYHGTLLGLVKTAIEENAGLFGASSGSNVTPHKPTAELWSTMRQDGHFVSDDEYGKTYSYEELNELMSPEAQQLDESVKYSPIVLEFEMPGEGTDQTGEWNNMPSYPWVFLGTPEGYLQRLTRKSKKEIIERLGYKEPFDWMDEEWREVFEETVKGEISELPNGPAGIFEPEILSKDLLGGIISFLFNKKLVLAFDTNLTGSRYPLNVLEEIEELKKKPRFKKLLQNLEIIKKPAKELVEDIKNKKDDRSEIFLFTRASEQGTFTGIRSLIHPTYISENDISINAYYPLIEIVAMALSHFLEPASIDRFTDEMLEAVNIGSVTADEAPDCLIVTLIPEAEALDTRKLMKRYAALRSCLLAA